jgi:YVTN family beta-propeller protein
MQRARHEKGGSDGEERGNTGVLVVETTAEIGSSGRLTLVTSNPDHTSVFWTKGGTPLSRQRYGEGVQMTKCRYRRWLVLAASLLLLGAFLPATVAASEGPAVVATISLGPNPDATGFALAVNPNTNKTYVTPGLEPLSCESHIVSVIDNSTNTLLTPITAGLSPFGVAVNPKTNKIYVANVGGCSESEPSNAVSVIDGSTDVVEKTITVDGLGPAWVAVNPKTNKIYVTINGGCCTSGHTVAVIDGSTDAVVRYIEVDPDPFIVAVNPRTNLVYVTHAGVDQITVIDGATDTVKTTFAIGSEARAIAFDSNRKLLYVAARNTNQLAIVDASTNAVLQTIPVGSRPHGVVFNPANGRIYVTNRDGCGSTSPPGTVSVIDSDTRAVVATVEVGKCPRFLDRNPRTGLLYVPNAATSRSVSVIEDDG